jgi:large subunit ribosomal protein L4
MQIDIYSSGGEKKKSMELPASLFGAEVNFGLMHQAVVMQQSNRRQSPAHVRTRGEVWGSTKKLFEQKHTGRARRGDIRSPSLRGGGKTFGPRNDKNYVKDMPQSMRHAALRSCLTQQANNGIIVGLESYPTTIKTKAAATLLTKLPIKLQKRVLFVLDGKHEGLQKSVKNIPSVKCVYAAYLNPEDILKARSIVFLVDAFKTAETVFGKKADTNKEKRAKLATEKSITALSKPKKVKRSPTAKKPELAPKRKTSSKTAS